MIDFSNHKIILASQSPRRQELLKGLDIPFVLAQAFDAEEKYPGDIPKRDVALYLAKSKSELYPNVLNAGEILITADTIVLCGNTLMGKPVDKNEAVNMLKELSGKKHEVITGVCLRSLKKKLVFEETTYVTFTRISDEEIEYYTDKYKPYDKAGAYGIQEWIGYAAIESVEGSFYNVMGLPVQRLYSELKYMIK